MTDIKTAAGFKEECIKAFDTLLKDEVLILKVPDWDSYIKAIKDDTKNIIVPGASTLVIENYNDGASLTFKLVDEYTYSQLVNLNQDYEKFIEIIEWPDSGSAEENHRRSMLLDYMIAPERAIREYFEREHGVDPLINEWKLS